MKGKNKMTLKVKFKTQIFIKLITFIVIGSFSLKLVNSVNSTDIEVINSPNNDIKNNDYQEILAKYDKTNSKIVIDGVTYDLRDSNALHSEEPGYKSMKTNEIIFSLINVLGI